MSTSIIEMVRVFLAKDAALRRVSTFGVGGQEFNMMEAMLCQIVKYRPGITSAEIAKAMKLTAAGVFSLVHKLTIKGCLTGITGNPGRKKKPLYLTTPGQAVAAIADDYDNVLKTALKGMEDYELDTLFTFLVRLKDCQTKFEAQTLEGIG